MHHKRLWTETLSRLWGRVTRRALPINLEHLEDLFGNEHDGSERIRKERLAREAVRRCWVSADGVESRWWTPNAEFYVWRPRDDTEALVQQLQGLAKQAAAAGTTHDWIGNTKGNARVWQQHYIGGIPIPGWAHSEELFHQLVRERFRGTDYATELRSAPPLPPPIVEVAAPCCNCSAL